MHELSIALSIIRIASETAIEQGVNVKAVHLKLGSFSGVVKDALLFSYGVACEGTPLEGSKLVIEEIPTVIYCPTCNAERTLPSIQLLACSVCNGLASEVVRGKELEVVGLEIQQ